MRIRSVKPEYWSAEDIGLLSRDARLLYIATWNVADDEGLLEWSARRLKVSVFPYDDDLGPDDVRELMDELVAAGFVHTYAQATVKRALRGKAKQPMLGWIVMFPHHQKPNRPQPTRLEPPPLDDPEVLLAYAYRDKWTCHRCKNPINDSGDAGDDGPALDDVEGITAPGFPSSIRAAHVRCATRQSRIHRDLSVQPQLDVDVPVEVAPTGTGPVLSVVPAPPVSHEPASVSGGFQGRRAAVGGSVSEVPARHSAQGSDDSESGPVRFSDTRFSERSSPERRGEEGEGRGSNLTSPGIFRHPLTDDATNNTPAAPARSSSSSSSTATDGAVDDPDFPTPDFPTPDFPTPDFPTPDFPTPDFPTPGGVEKSATSVSVTDKTTGTPQSRGRPKIEVDPQTAEFLDEICEIISRSAEEATGRPTPPTDRWRTEVERLLRVDGRAPGQVRAVVDWMSGHGFWRTQITTGRHLRTHFPDLFGNDQFAQWTIKQNLPDDDRPAKARGRRISRTGKASP